MAGNASLEARVGIEPTHKGFADHFLSSLTLSVDVVLVSVQFYGFHHREIFFESAIDFVRLLSACSWAPLLFFPLTGHGKSSPTARHGFLRCFFGVGLRVEHGLYDVIDRGVTHPSLNGVKRSLAHKGNALLFFVVHFHAQRIADALKLVHSVG